MNKIIRKNWISGNPGKAGEDAWKRLFDCVEGVELMPLPNGREILRLAQQERDRENKY